MQHADPCLLETDPSKLFIFNCVASFDFSQSVTKRVKENASEIDAEEWNNISKFLRIAYSTGEDLKVVAAGIKNPANKQRALDDIEQLKKYAQAGDIPVSKKDADGFVAVSTKMLELMNDYFDALIDVPDEI